MNIKDIAERVRTQDNRCTHNPIFIVRQKKKRGKFEYWEFVTACFTEEGCKEYLRQDGHNLRGEVEIFVAGGYRNDEWEAVREHLKGIGQ
jgi:hypothetical protein